jgi:hypothetical protein
MKRALLLVTMTMGAVLSGCAANGAYVVRYGPPPPPRYGIVGYAPGPGYIWTDGYWDRHGGQWVWIGGRWMRPPRPHAVWVPGLWVQEGRAWRFRRGYWH